MFDDFKEEFLKIWKEKKEACLKLAGHFDDV